MIFSPIYCTLISSPALRRNGATSFRSSAARKSLGRRLALALLWAVVLFGVVKAWLHR